MTAISVKKKIDPINNNRHFYSVPAGKAATVNLTICNLNDTQSRRVNVIITDATPFTAADYIEYRVRIPPSGVLERIGLVMKAGDSLYVSSLDGTDVAARMHGFEENL